MNYTCVICLDRKQTRYGVDVTIDNKPFCQFKGCRQCGQQPACKICIKKLMIEYLTDRGCFFKKRHGLLLFRCPLCRAVTVLSSDTPQKLRTDTRALVALAWGQAVQAKDTYIQDALVEEGYMAPK
jgi:hypothetical protein